MFRVYLDGILQDENDIININDLAEFTIIREDGFNSTEQILREKTEMQLSFGGNAYCYIHDKIKNEQCAQIDFLIEDDCGLSYNGIIPVTSSELNVFEKYGKVSIKDNSFSAYIRDYMNVDISLFNRKTINCQNLNSVIKSFRMKKTYNNDTDIIAINAFDVLDVFKYIINYLTDNTINVLSTYLTNNKYAITTGFNMHNYAGGSNEIYPEISMQTLYEELRKKLRLYMAVEYSGGNAYLRIEHEDYFFSNTTPLFNLNIQPKTVQKYDIDRNFNIIDIGSTDYLLSSEDSIISYPQKRYISWNKETYNSCGTCSGKKENKLDLVSELIIDTNVIYEVLNWSTSDYKYDQKLFLFNYETILGDNVPIRNLINSNYVYNYSIINENVLQNWIDYYGKCISIARYPANGFYLDFIGYTLTTQALPGIDGATDGISFTNIVYDLNTVTFNYSGNAIFPANVDRVAGIYPTSFRYFEAPVNGTYNLRAELIRFIQSNRPTIPCSLNVELQIITYTDNTFSTILNTYSVIGNTANSVTTPVSLNLETGNIFLNAGECAALVLSFYDYSGTIIALSLSFEFIADNITFELISDGTCESIDYNNQNSKPYEVELQYPLCYEDFELARQNKNGYITMANNRYWIKEINYKPKRLSTLKLIGNNSL